MAYLGTKVMLPSPGEADDGGRIEQALAAMGRRTAALWTPAPPYAPPHCLLTRSISQSNDNQAEVSPRVDKWHQFPGPVIF